MTEISKTRKQNQRGAAPGVVDPSSESLEYPGEGADTSQVQEQAPRHGSAQLVAQYSHAGAHQGAPAPRAIGEAPGSPSYYGSSPQPATERGALETAFSPRPGTPATAPALKSIGEPPGSPSYYGQGQARGATSPSAASSATRATLRAIGEPPGSAQYFGRSGTAPGAAYGPYGQAPTPQRAPASQYSPGPAQPGGRAPHVAQPLATVGLPPGSAAYSGGGMRGRGAG